MQSNEVRNTVIRYFWEEFGKKPENVLKRRCPPTNWSQSENIIDKFLLLKREKASVYKTVVAIFEFCKLRTRAIQVTS